MKMMLLGFRSQLQVVLLFLTMFVTAALYYPLAGLINWLLQKESMNAS
jgi:hypothetical protein